MPMAEKDTLKFTQNSKKTHDYLLRLFQKKRTETWSYNLNCWKLQCLQYFYQLHKNKEKKYITHTAYHKNL